MTAVDATESVASFRRFFFSLQGKRHIFFIGGILVARIDQLYAGSVYGGWELVK